MSDAFVHQGTKQEEAKGGEREMSTSIIVMRRRDMSEP